jgi:hypothetical protein
MEVGISREFYKMFEKVPILKRDVIARPLLVNLPTVLLSVT